MNRPTIRDVAERAGVSVSSVSRALSQSGGASPRLTRRVQSAAEELGYQANSLARSLRTSATGTIGMVVPSLSNLYFVGLIEAIEQDLAKDGKALIVCDSTHSTLVEAARLQILEERMVDGLIVVPLDYSKSAEALSVVSKRIPTVFLDRKANVPNVDYVGTDSAAGLREIISHLKKMGAKNIVYAGVRPGSNTASERNAAFRELVGLPPGANEVEGHVMLGDFTIEWGEEVARRLLRFPQMPDAVVCAADIIAVPLISELKEAGVRIPQDVRVASFDDSVLSRIVIPRVTSVAHPLNELSRFAISMLEDRTCDRDTPARQVQVTPELVIRASTEC